MRLLAMMVGYTLCFEASCILKPAVSRVAASLRIDAHSEQLDCDNCLQDLFF